MGWGGVGGEGWVGWGGVGRGGEGWGGWGGVVRGGVGTYEFDMNQYDLNTFTPHLTCKCTEPSSPCDLATMCHDNDVTQ